MKSPSQSPARESFGTGAPPASRTRSLFGAIGVLLLVAAATGIWQALIRSSEPSLRVPSMKMLSEPCSLPPLDIRDAEGKVVSLERFRGKVVLLNLWATWCGPCRTEVPALDRLQAKLGGPNFEVVALSADVGGVQSVREFYDSLKLTRLSIYVVGDGNALATLTAPGLPTTLLIDTEGRELGRYLGAADWESERFAGALQQLLEKLAKVKKR